MYRIAPVTAPAAAHAFYHETRVPRESYAACEEMPPLSLAAVSRETVAWWFFGESRVTVGAYAGERLVGLASGVTDAARGSGFLSYLCVHPAHRRMGLATRLCDELEARLLATEGVDKLEAIFYNPVHLPWYIPPIGTGSERETPVEGAYHPCLPGVDRASSLYPFLKARGWWDYAIQNAYYRRLSDYRDSPDMAEARARLLSEGIELTRYDPARHYGLPELFDNIRNPGWKAQVLAHLDRPVVVAVDRHAPDAQGRALVVAYTGPLSQDGTPARGNFCGIGTHTAYRGRGIGKQVFCAMCRAHRDAGADFMSLYTGDSNPARHIYESAGFRIVRSFADMRRE